MQKLVRSAFLSTLVICAVQAQPVHWQLNGVVFNDGGRLFGGFDYDPTVNTYSNINLTTTPGGINTTGGFYNSAAPYANSTAAGYLNGVSTVPVFSGSTTALALAFSPSLSAIGGTVNIVAIAAESTCANSTCGSVTPQRTITAGTATAVSTTSARRWQLQNVTLSDGSQAFGSFVYDSNTGTYSQMSITTTAGIGAASVLPGTSYFNVNPSAGSGSLASAVSASTIVSGTTTVFSASFASALTDAGGTVNINTVSEGLCSSSTCASSGTLRTMVSTGIVSTTFITDDSKVLPQIADGGGFITQLIFTNPTGASISSRLTFWGNTGTLLPLSLNGATASSGYTVVVPGHSSVFLSTPGGTGNPVQGWALATNAADLSVTAAYRLQLSGVPESEATVVGIDPTVGFAMPFDETTGFDTGFALTNFSGNDTVTEFIYFYDPTGKLLYSDSTHTLPPHGHESFQFSGRYASTPIMGQRGEVRVYYGTAGAPTAPIGGLTGMGLRINPALTFTSLQTFTINDVVPQ